MTNTNDEALIAALRQAGHVQAADHVRDSALARTLEDAGHEDLAASLKAKLAPVPTEPPPEPTPPDPVKAEGDAIRSALIDSGIWEEGA